MPCLLFCWYSSLRYLREESCLLFYWGCVHQNDLTSIPSMSEENIYLLVFLIIFVAFIMFTIIILRVLAFSPTIFTFAFALTVTVMTIIGSIVYVPMDHKQVMIFLNIFFENCSLIHDHWATRSNSDSPIISRSEYMLILHLIW